MWKCLEPTWTRHASTMCEIDDDQERTLILSFNDKSKERIFQMNTLYVCMIIATIDS